MREVPFGPLTERDDFVVRSSLDERQQVERHAIAASMYHDVVHGTPEAVRQAAQWMVEHSRSKSELRLDDEYHLGEKEEEHAKAALENKEAAERIETWAANIFDTRDSEAVIALTSIGKYGRLNLEEAVHNPRRILSFENRVDTEEAHIAELVAKQEELAKKGASNEDVLDIDVADSVRVLKPGKGETLTIGQLLRLEAYALANELENTREEHQRMSDILDTLRTGSMSEELRRYVLAVNPAAFGDEIPPAEIPEEYEDMLIEELEISIRPYNCFKRGGLLTVADIMRKSEAELLNLPEFGEKTMDEVREVLGAKGIILRKQPAQEEPEN